MLEIGSLIAGKYRVLHEIGKGGMSTVYLVLNERANKQWALKEVHKTSYNNTTVVTRSIVTELSILRKLDHDYLPAIADVIENEESFLILMDYIEGVPLSRILRNEGAQKEQDVIKWMKQLCDVLEYLHSQDPPIIYRDLKPSNIMLRPNGDITLIDFGTAKEYHDTGDDTTSLGTRGYAAPEQMESGGRSDARTDIYSLGATAYHLLTNSSPVVYPYEMYPIRLIDPTLSGGLERIIWKCTQNNPDNRYPTCRALLYDLEHYYEFDEAFKKKRKRKIASVVAALVMATACITGGFFMQNMAKTLAEDNYDAYMKKAKTSLTDSDMRQAYINAIEASPSQLEPYEDLINNAYLSDGNFTQKEAEELTSVLNTRTGAVTNAEALENAGDYSRLSYLMGIAYYYYYEKEGNAALAKPWFDIAKEDETIGSAKQARADILSRLTDYDRSLAVLNKAGDSEVGYEDYFATMKDLAEMDIIGTDNARTALVTYKELSYILYRDIPEYHKAGVDRKEVENVISNISEKTQEAAGTSSDDNDRTMAETIGKNLEKAREETATAYKEN